MPCRAESKYILSLFTAKKEELLQDKNELVMLYDPSDRDFAGMDTFVRFAVQARGNATEDPRHCRLSERFVMVGQGQEELDVRRQPVMKALCEYLRGVQTGGMELGDFSRAAETGRGYGTLQRWETLGDDGPFEIVMQPGRRAGRTFESDSVRDFWSMMDAAGALSVPGTLELLTTVGPSANPEVARLVAEVEALSEGWHAFADNLQTVAFYQEWEAGEGIGPPPLKKLERVSVANLRVGWAVTTRGFERKLLCAAAWYAEQRQLIEQFARTSFCTVYP